MGNGKTEAKSQLTLTGPSVVCVVACAEEEEEEQEEDELSSWGRWRQPVEDDEASPPDEDDEEDELSLDPRLTESSLAEAVDVDDDEDEDDDEEEEIIPPPPPPPAPTSTRFLLDLLLRSTLDGLQCFSILGCLSSLSLHACKKTWGKKTRP